LSQAPPLALSFSLAMPEPIERVIEAVTDGRGRAIGRAKGAPGPAFPSELRPRTRESRLA
jgi:hypothetical protein